MYDLVCEVINHARTDGQRRAADRATGTSSQPFLGIGLCG